MLLNFETLVMETVAVVGFKIVVCAEPAPIPSASNENDAVPEVTLPPAVKFSVPPPSPLAAKTDSG